MWFNDEALFSGLRLFIIQDRWKQITVFFVEMQNIDCYGCGHNLFGHSMWWDSFWMNRPSVPLICSDLLYIASNIRSILEHLKSIWRRETTSKNPANPAFYQVSGVWASNILRFKYIEWYLIEHCETCQQQLADQWSFKRIISAHCVSVRISKHLLIIQRIAYRFSVNSPLAALNESN